MRVRRLALVAVLALVAGVSLAGCRSAPSVAAYVGDHKVTIDEVNGLAGELNTPADQHSVIVSQVISAFVIRDLGERLVAEKSLSMDNSSSADDVAQSLHLAAGSKLAPLLAETNNVLRTLAASATTVDPTEEQQRTVYETMTFNGQSLAPSLPFEQVRPLLTKSVLGPPLALQAMLNEAAAKSDITVNPRYGSLNYRLSTNVPDKSGQLAEGYVNIQLSAPSIPVKSASSSPVKSA